MLSQADPARSHYLPMNLKTKYPVIVRAEGRYLYAANPLSTAIGSAVLRYILDNDLVRRSATPETFRLSERCKRGCCISGFRRIELHNGNHHHHRRRPDAPVR